jgi:hypothetical protein
VRDLPCFQFRTTVVIELYRVHCPNCGIKTERVEPLPSKAPFSKRFEEELGQAREGASARQVARRFGLAASTVRAIDLRYLERWKAKRRMPALEQMGVDGILLGKKQKFIAVVSNLETGEPLWFGRERKKETLDGFFQKELSVRQRAKIEAAGGVFPQGRTHAGFGERQTLVAVDALGKSDQRQKAGPQRPVRHEPRTHEGLSAERESRPALDVPL